MAAFIKRLRLFRFHRISHRLTFALFMMVTSVVTIITIVTVSMFTNTVAENKLDIFSSQFTILNNHLRERIIIVNEVTSLLRNDEIVQRYLSGENLSADNIKKTSVALSDYFSSNSDYKRYYITKILAISNDDHVLDPLFSLDNYSKLILENKYFREFQQGPFTLQFSPPVTMPADVRDNQTINCMIKYLDTNTFEQKGYLQISFKKNYFFASDPTESTSFDTIYVINRAGHTIYAAGASTDALDQYVSDTSRFINSGFNRETIGKENYYVFSGNVPNYSDWIMVGFISKSNLYAPIYRQNALIYTIGALFLLLAALIFHRLSRRIVKPIKDVVGAMEMVKHGDWPDPLSSGTKDELHDLAEGFNSMADNIHQLIHDIYAGQEERKKAEVLALQYQLEMLQYQINPHFIHNTINAISYLALKNNQNEIREIVQAFSLLLRRILSDADELVTLSSEIECIESFLHIQKSRYGDIFAFTCELCPQIAQVNIPKFCIQPLVENALFHGIVPRGKGTIFVDFEQIDNKIKISVSDDGVGIQAESIDALSACSSKRGLTKIGLKNVNERLSLYFGRESMLQLDKTVLAGTRIYFTIPIDGGMIS